MTKTLEFLFDYGAPNAYLAWKALPPLIERTGAELVLTPVLLGGVFKATGNRAPMIRYADSPAKWAYEQLELRRFIAAHALTRFRTNPHFPVNTVTLMRIAVAAQAMGHLQALNDVAFAAMWEDGENMGDAETIARVLTAGGFDGDALIDATQDQAIKDTLTANTQAAIDRGVFGVPTFFVGGEMFWGKERFAQVEAALGTLAA